MLKRNLAFAAIAALGISLSACSSGQSSTVTSASSAVETSSEDSQGSLAATSESAVSEVSEPDDATRTIVDHAGNEVVIPAKIERIVIDQIPILSTYVAYHEGSAPYIVGLAGSFQDVISETVLKEIAPELLEASAPTYAQGDLNIEEVINLKPDVVLYNANNTAHKELFEQAGIPAVGFATVNPGTPADPILRYKQWLELLEEVFNEPERADAIIAYGEEKIGKIEASISDIPVENRPNALILFQYVDGVPQVAGKGIFGDYWLKHLGVVNVAGEAQAFAQVSFEQIYTWNPDILFLNGPGLLSITTDEVISNTVEGADFSPLKAVSEKKVYNTKLGMWNWFTPNPDAPLILAWLATKAYPEEFADYPLNEEIKEYYKTFYHYDLSDEQIEDIFKL